MTDQMNVEGLSIAPGVMETIISVAASEVDGVASLGSFATSGIRSMLASKPSTSGIETKMGDVTQVANFEKKVPDEWITADGMHVNANFERYARPLIQAELTPIYINGVPRHIHLD